MARLNVINIPSPGILGLNTEDTGVDLPIEFAKIATNGVISQDGRMSARKGLDEYTPVTPFTGEVKSIYEVINDDGTTELIWSAGNKIYAGYPNAVDITGGATITDDNWQFAFLQDKLYAVQAGHTMLSWKKIAGVWTPQVFTYGASPGELIVTDEPNSIISAFGRLFVADGVNKQKVWFSTELDGLDFDSFGSGFIDISEVVVGGDNVVAVSSMGNRLVIHCRNQTVLYFVDPEATPFLELEEVIVGVGCLARDSIVNTGTDLLWLADQGIVSVGRLIQSDGQMPIGNISKHIHTAIQDELDNVSSFEGIKAVWWSVDKAYLLFFKDTKNLWYFNFRNPKAEAPVCFKWTNMKTTTSLYSTVNRELLFGGEDTFYFYRTYGSSIDSYTFSYYSGYLDFGAPESFKFLKNLSFLVKTSVDQAVSIKWAFDYNDIFESVVSVTKGGGGEAAEYGSSEYGEGEYGGGSKLYDLRTQASLSGQSLQFGIETQIIGSEFVVFRCEVQATLGKSY
jgi:hypothetical protein